MQELVIISGKGGTGKTSITAAFAQLADKCVIADCDVDAADMYLILDGEQLEATDFVGGKEAVINSEKCIACGRCMNLCRFNAITFTGAPGQRADKTYKVNPLKCEGCKVCVEICPADAIDFVDSVNGSWYISDSRFGKLFHAKLGPGEENSGKLVSLLRDRAKKQAIEENRDYIIVDGSPGIGCPVIASITGADAVVIVTEPTLSGLSDLKRVKELTEHFNINASVCINKYDINLEMTEQIKDYCASVNLSVDGQISYSKDFVSAQIEGKTLLEYSDTPVSKQVRDLWRSVNKTHFNIEKI